MKLTEGELAAWARRIGTEVRPPVFIGLTGPLGAGKSVFARAVAGGAGVETAIPSPTFNLVFRYPLPGEGSVIHADLFRINSVAELTGIGWDDMLAEDDAIMLVEWCDRAGGEVPDDRWEISLSYVEDEPEMRVVDVERRGDPPGLPQFAVAAG